MAHVPEITSDTQCVSGEVGPRAMTLQQARMRYKERTFANDVPASGFYQHHSGRVRSNVMIWIIGSQGAAHTDGMQEQSAMDRPLTTDWIALAVRLGSALCALLCSRG